VKDAPRRRARLAIGRRKAVSDDGCIRRRGCQYLGNEHRDAGAADAPRTVFRAGVGARAARVLDAIVGDHAGEQVGTLANKGRQPHGEKKPHHVANDST